MFIQFFYALKAEGVPVSLSEWWTLMEALAKGLSGPSLNGFYWLARAILVKNEAHYDQYDQAFLKYFRGLGTSEAILADALAWLQNPLPPLNLSPEEREKLAQQMQHLDLEELQRQFEERLRQQTEEHHGGSHWIGTGGTSPFGHSGFHPGGMRVGGESLGRSAVKVAAERRYREYRRDVTIGVRQFEAAFKQLRRLATKEEGPRDQLDLDETIKTTADHAGLLQLEFRRERKNNFKVLLLMDSGGSMYEHARICDQLFTAVNKITHFQDLKIYYFHNCVYDKLYHTHHCHPREATATEQVLKSLGPAYRVFLVGDASMAPSELTLPGGIIWWGENNQEPGIYWLRRLRRHYQHAAWLNPIPEGEWERVYGSHTLRLVREVFPMFELTVQGLAGAIKAVTRG